MKNSITKVSFWLAAVIIAAFNGYLISRFMIPSTAISSGLGLAFALGDLAAISFVFKRTEIAEIWRMAAIASSFLVWIGILNVLEKAGAPAVSGTGPDRILHVSVLIIAIATTVGLYYLRKLLVKLAS